MIRFDLEECNSTDEEDIFLKNVIVLTKKIYCLDQEGTSRMSEAYLQTGWIFATELFCENS